MKSAFAAIALVLVASAATAQETSGKIIVSDCSVRPISVTGQAQVPAEEAGKITAINVREGGFVRAGEVLAFIDDTQPQKQKLVAIAEHKAAKQKADSDIDIEHATAAAKVAEFDLASSKVATDKVTGSVSEVDMEQKRFQWKRALLAIKQARNEQIVNGFTAEAKLAEAQAADDAIQRRRIVSPIDGVVQQVKPSVGEWVKPGDGVFRILKMDQLRVEGFVEDTQISPGQLIDRPVTVEVAAAGGKSISFKGKIVFVDPEVFLKGQRVYAEVENRQDSAGHWMLRPGIGLNPTMTIQLR
jgi:multidrug efflux pump subunit AcrA (membrane-fusion protein)